MHVWRHLAGRLDYRPDASSMCWDLSPRFLLLIAAVVAAAASFSLPFVRLVTLLCWMYRSLLRWLG